MKGGREGIIACLALSATQSRCNGLGSLFYIVNFSQELSQFFFSQLDSHIFKTKSRNPNNERSHFIIIKLFHFLRERESVCEREFVSACIRERKRKKAQPFEINEKTRLDNNGYTKKQIKRTSD